jgi:hypothetical protein
MSIYASTHTRPLALYIKDKNKIPATHICCVAGILVAIRQPRRMELLTRCCYRLNS